MEERLEMSERLLIKQSIKRIEALPSRSEGYLEMSDPFCIFKNGFSTVKERKSFCQLRYDHFWKEYFLVVKQISFPHYNVLIYAKTDSAGQKMSEKIKKKFLENEIENPLMLLFSKYTEKDPNVSFVRCLYVTLMSLKQQDPLAVHSAISNGHVKLSAMKQQLFRHL